MNDKAHLINTLSYLLDQYDFGVIASLYFKHYGGYENMHKMSIGVGGPNLKSDEFVNKVKSLRVNGGYNITNKGFLFHMPSKVDKLNDPKFKDAIYNEFDVAQRRYIGNITFELIKAYCQNTGQYEKMKTAPWFDFSLVQRNFSSHHGAAKWPAALKGKAVSNLDRTYDENTPLEEIRFDGADVISMVLEQYSWVLTELD